MGSNVGYVYFEHQSKFLLVRLNCSVDAKYSCCEIQTFRICQAINVIHTLWWLEVSAMRLSFAVKIKTKQNCDCH
jgi:hypothetical protein